MISKIPLRPQPWTHHHTHRLFHLSMGFCFAFAALAMIGTMGTVWMQANAGIISQSNNLTVSATVDGISSEPSTGAIAIGAMPKPTPNPTITIVAEPAGYVPNQGASYVFATFQPRFSGNTNVSNGLIFLTIRGPMDLNMTTQADSTGHWNWQSPVDLPQGEYTIRAAVFDSLDLTRSGNAEASFIVSIPGLPNTNGNTNKNTNSTNTNSNKNTNKNGNKNTNNNTGSTNPPPSVPPIIIPGIPNPTPPPGSENINFGVFFKLQSNSKYIYAGDKITGETTIVTNSDVASPNQKITYTVLSPKGQVILQTTDSVDFSKNLTVQKTFNTAAKTAPGDYIIVASSAYQGKYSVGYDIFTILPPASAGSTVAPIVPSSPVILWMLLILLWLLFMIMVIIAYRYVRHHTREINSAA